MGFLPVWCCGSHSPSRASSRLGSGSPDGSRHRSCFCLHFPSRRANKDRQEEQSSLDFVDVVVHMWSVNDLLEAPSENHKILGFRAMLDDDDQLALSYCLPVCGESADILADINDHILSTSTGMRSKKVSKLLPYPEVSSCSICHFEREELVKTRSLNRHVTELTGMRSFENPNKTDVILSSSEAEDLAAAVRSIVEATSWMD